MYFDFTGTKWAVLKLCVSYGDICKKRFDSIFFNYNYNKNTLWIIKITNKKNKTKQTKSSGEGDNQKRNGTILVMSPHIKT